MTSTDGLRDGPGLNLLRRILGSGLAKPIRAVIRPFRPAAAAFGLVDKLPTGNESSLAGWSSSRLARWFSRSEISGTTDSAAKNARRLLAEPSLHDTALFLTVGEILLRRGVVPEATEAFLRARATNPDVRYHYGQLLFDYLQGRDPRFAELSAVAQMAATPQALVPDLAKLVLRLLWQSEATARPEGQTLIALVAMACDHSGLLDLGNAALAGGGHAKAMRAYGLAMQRDSHDVLTRLQMGVTEFLAGRYVEAEQQFAVMESTRALEKSRWGVEDLPVTIMHATWTQAIGHIASLDTYVKSMQLGWLPKQRSILAFDTRTPPSGWPLLKYWAKHIEVIGAPEEPAEVVDRRLWPEDSWKRSERDKRRASLLSTFWCGPDGDGRIRWYGPLGSAVQHAWKAEGRAPLLSLDDAERHRFRIMMEQAFGLPRDAWFVLLHVRESGYKQQWETNHAYTRNADISTYDDAVARIIERGGWVVRGGDPSMRPIPPRANVIDYATSPLRSAEIDIQLCAECHFFLGTNSGFSLVPPLFGRRCALTNWSPLGTPNWYPDDLFIPKLARRRSDGTTLTFAEMYSTVAGWSQFQRDFVGEFEKVDNTPEDLLDLTEEMLDLLDGTATLTAEDDARRAVFEAVTLSHGGYLGSRLGSRFAAKYAHLIQAPA